MIYNLLKICFDQLPNIFSMITTAPVVVIQIILLVAVVIGADVIIAVAEKLIAFVRWLNSKL